METTKSSDAGSKSWLKERAAISAAHRRQKTDPAAARLIEKADQLHKERTQRNLRETVDEDDEVMDGVPETLKKNEAEDEDLEDIDAIVNVPPPEEVVVKIVQKPAEEDTIASNHGKEASEEVYRSFAESVLEQGLTTESELELSFDLKPEDIKIKEIEEEEIEEEEEEEEEEIEEEEKEKEGEEKNEEEKNEEEKNEEEKNEDLNEADITEEKVQEKLKGADVEINHNEENKGDVEDKDDGKSEESTLTKEVDVDTVPKNND